MAILRRILRAFSLFLTILLPASLAAQAPPPAQAAPSVYPSQQAQVRSPDKSKSNSDIKRQQETGTSNDRLFYALPNFLTVETKNVPRLTAGQNSR